ncbi:hypothetical protein [Niallia sp. 03190]|uniref:hypothetical protein n=1 Tax=Niallia sp. 03190 TaxID=3458061 RepID=UPI004043A108
MPALPKQQDTYIEEELETEKEFILFDSTHWIWPIVFWVVFIGIAGLIGIGVING